MAKIRVHELAKELDIQSKDVCLALSQKGVEVKPQSSVTDEDAEYIRKKFSKSASAETEPEIVKEAEKDNESKAVEKKAEEKTEEKNEEKTEEKAKPKRIITSKGIVIQGGADGERRRHKRPEGERRRRPEGERVRKEPEKEAKKTELTPEMMKARFEQALNKKSDKEIKNEASAAKKEENVNVTADNAAENTVSKKEEAVNKVSDVKVNEINTAKTKTADTKEDAKTVAETETQKSETKQAETKAVETKPEIKEETVELKTSEETGKNIIQQPNNDVKKKRPETKNDYKNDNRDRRQGERKPGDNRNEGRRQGDRNDNRRQFDNRNDRRNQNDNRGDFKRQNSGDQRQGGFKDRNNQSFAGKDDNQRQNFRDRNDRRQKDNAPAADVIQDKDRKSRENKLRQDKQDRNKKNYEDGQRGGKNGKGFQLQHKSLLQKPQKKKEEKKEEIKIISIPEVINIGELAEKMKMPASTIIKKLFLEGKMVTVNSELDFETAEEIAMGYEIMCEKEEKVDVIEELLREEEEAEDTMVKRPPVVCVMGHVDHGKTSLLDAIKSTNVISQEAGGITQHIGAYMVEAGGQKITFLDTPGHEAFTAMRMRGAQSTDIAILVVAADDGVMPQTIEAINHAKAADIEIIVAINKIDKPGANIDRVKQELAEYELLAEDWGGNTIMVPVSAHTREGIDTLLEMVILQADILELKANPNRRARGLIIEAKLDKGKGSVATVLVQKGTLKVGDHIAAGSNYGRVRAMVDDKGRQVKEATPSTPVSILGLNGVPNAGEVLVSTDTGNEARSFAETFIKEGREKLLEGTKYRLSLEDLNSQIEAGNLKELNLIIKADVQGSVEAIKQSMLKLSNDEVEVKVIHGGVGAINESDVILASASNAIIIGFNVKPDNQAQDVAQREQVDVRLYSVIYRAIEDVESAMKGMLDPVFEEKVIGHAEIRQIFKASGVGNIAGSYVLDGNFERGCMVRITREGEQIFEGQLASLKRFKDDVKEVKAGYECGLVFDGFNEIAELDQVEAYKMVEVPR